MNKLRKRYNKFDKAVDKRYQALVRKGNISFLEVWFNLDEYLIDNELSDLPTIEITVPITGGTITVQCVEIEDGIIKCIDNLVGNDILSFQFHNIASLYDKITLIKEIELIF